MNWVTSLTLLANGRVLVLSSNGNYYADAHLFDPGAGGTWRQTLRPPGIRLHYDGVSLAGGDVLFVTDYLEHLSFALYDVETERFSYPFPNFDIQNWSGSYAKATVLPDGRVLLVGGFGNDWPGPPVPFAAVFDPATGVTAPLPSMAEARVQPATVVLPDGRVLVSGGDSKNHYGSGELTGVTSAEVLDLWPGVVESWRPVISTWPSSLSMPGAFTLMGTGFRGGAEASGGNGALNSSADAPSVLLRRVEGGLARWVPSSSTSDWSSTRFPSAAVSGLPSGAYRATLFASGRPSISRAISVTACGLTTGVLESTSEASVCQGQPLVLSARAIKGATYLWSHPDGSTSTDRVLTIPGAQLDDGGFYTVVATKDGCTSPSDTVSIDVAPLPRGLVIEAPSELGGNEGGVASVELYPGSVYEWTLSSGSIDTGQGTNEIRFNAPSTGTSMTVAVVETVGATCVQPTAQKTITVIPCSVATPTASNTGPYCTYATISLSTPSVPGASVYYWYGPASFYSNEQNPTISHAQFFNAGEYSVTVKVGNCLSARGSTTVVVNPVPVAPVIIAPASVAPGEYFAASVPDVVGASWSWIVTNGTLLGGGGTRQIVVVAGETGPVTLTVTETYAGTGCGSQVASVAIPVGSPRDAVLPGDAVPAVRHAELERRRTRRRRPSRPGTTRTFTIGTRCGLTASTVRSLSVNQTVASADGRRRARRSSAAISRPYRSTSNISYRAGKTRANNGILELSRSGDGTFKVTNRSTGTVDFILDVNGVFE